MAGCSSQTHSKLPLCCFAYCSVSSERMLMLEPTRMMMRARETGKVAKCLRAGTRIFLWAYHKSRKMTGARSDGTFSI